MDRNDVERLPEPSTPWSLSARRAWIEILASGINPDQSGVALRKESVDRNCYYVGVWKWYIWSLSARRAWIEMIL